MTALKRVDTFLDKLGHLLGTLAPGESCFFGCPNDGCYAAVAGCCAHCGGIWAWCGCSANNFDCPCGANEETVEDDEEVTRLTARVRGLEQAIRDHRRRAWGEAAVESKHDDALYRALEADAAAGEP